MKNALLLFVALLLATLSNNVQGQLYNTEPFNPPEPTISATQAPGVWYPDRYQPAAFESYNFSSENVLRLQISAADAAANRGAQNGTFYNTQGRKFDLANDVTVLYGDLYIPADWATKHRRSDLWATAYNGTGTTTADITDYPIIGFANTTGSNPTLRYWFVDNWANLPLVITYNKWYKFKMVLSAGQVTYYVDGVSVATVPSAGSAYFGNIIVQGYNFGDAALPLANQDFTEDATYDVYWDNIGTNNGEVIASINTIPSSCGTLDVPVTVKNFNDVGAISLTMKYDAAKLAYQSIDLAAITGANVNTGTPGKITIGKFPVPAITLGDDEVLFTLHFNVLSSVASGSSTDLVWDDAANTGYCEFAGPGGMPVYNSTFIDKTVTIPDRLVKNMTTEVQYCSLQEAINAASANQTLQLLGDITEGLISLNKDLTIDGNGKILTSTSPSYGLAITVPGVVIQSMTVKNAGTFGIHVGCGSDNLELTNVTVTQNGGSGIAINGSDGVLLTNITSTNNIGTGLSIANCNNMVISGITTSNNSFAGGFSAGIGLFTTEAYCLPSGINGITLSGSVNISEPVKVYSEKTVASQTITGLVGTQFTWAMGMGDKFRFYYPTKADAYTAVDATFDANAAPNTAIYVVEVATEDFYVNDDPASDNLPPMLINTAIALQVPGENIFVEAGTYNENVVVNKALTLKGANADVACGSRVDESIILGSAAIAVEVAADNVTVNGFTISNPLYNFGIFAKGRNNTDISYNVITNIGNSVSGSGASYGVAIEMGSAAITDNVKIANNCISNIRGGENTSLTGAAAKANNGSAGAIGIGWSNADFSITDLVIENNQISGITACIKEFAEGGKGGYGILIGVGAKAANAGKVIDGIIRSNVISNLEGLWAHGIGLEGDTPGALVTKNTISNLTDHKTEADAIGVMVEDNDGAATVLINNNSLTLSELGIKNKTLTPVSAECNWYGSADYNLVFPKIEGSVDFVPYLVTNDINSPNCSGAVPPVHNLTQNLYYNSIQEAIDATTTVDNDVIAVEVADFTEPGLIRITKSLTIQGLGKSATIVRCNVNTANGNHGEDPSIWISGSAGKVITLKDMTLDATGKSVKYGVVFRSDGFVTNVAINHIKTTSQYYGIAVQVLNGDVDVTGCTFTNIGRIGVHYRNGVIPGAAISGLYDNNVYTGKGVGDWLDYALDISGGVTVTVSNSTISGNTGVAVSDGSTSAAIMATTYFPFEANLANNVTITGNTITANTTGIVVGYDVNDVSSVKAEGNKIYGNVYGLTSKKQLVDASPNWWGHASGPKNTPENVCGLGNEVSANVTFRQWYTDAAMTTLSAAPSIPVVSVPATMASTVECVASATAPAVLPEVKDFCGTVLLPTATSPLRTETITNCEGSVTYAYTYTDAIGGSLVWTYTYTIDRITPPVLPANSSKTVACPTDAVIPSLLSTVVDQQQIQIAANPNWTDFTSIGQSFTCGTSGWLTKLDLQVGSIAAAQNFTLQIYQGNGILGTLLYTGSHSLTATGWQSLNIAQELAPYLTAGTQYTFWLTSFTYNQLGLLCMTPSTYSGGVSMDGCTSGCSPTYAWQQWPAYDLVFKTYMTAVPIVKDVCGNVIPTPTPVLTDGTYNGCEGTKLYTYTYTDCAGNSTPWVFTYTIERNNFTMPPNTTATVACVSSVVVPTPPVVNDNCGNPITPVAGTTPTPPACEGTMVYQWTYTDCEGNINIWKHTVTIDDNVAPTITTCPPAVTVNMNTGCTATGVVLVTPIATDNCSGNVTFTNDAPTAFPLGNTTVTWTAKDCALNASTCTQIVTVVKNTLSGKLVYNNTAKTPMGNVTLQLSGGDLTTPLSTVTSILSGKEGEFEFANLCAGEYTIAVTNNNKDVGYINATDAAQVNAWVNDPIEHVKFLAGDVNSNNLINSTDANAIQNYFVNGITFTRVWSYWKQGATINSNSNPYSIIPADNKPWPADIKLVVSGNVSNFNLFGMGTGDFNGSFTPDMLKSANPSLTLAENSNLQIGASQAFELPLRAAYAMQVGAVSMILDIPSELVTVKNVKINGSTTPVSWAIKGNELRIGWHSLNPVNVAENGALVTLELMTTNAFAEGQTLDIALPFNPLNELADGNFEAMDYAELMVAKVGNQAVGNIAIDKNGGLLFSNYPNPFTKVTTLEYSLPVDGKVTINLFNNLGQLVSVLVDAEQMAGQHTFRYESNTLQPGIYVAKLRLVNSETEMVGTIKLSVQK